MRQDNDYLLKMTPDLDQGYEIQNYPHNEKYYCSSFCKTQFASSVLEHYFVAEIIRSVASRSFWCEINDEGDYYYSGEMEDARKAIEENGALINSIGGMLSGLGLKDTDVIKGGETKIKSTKRK